MSTDPATSAYYRSLYALVHGKPGPHQVVGNPGTAAASAWQLTTPVADAVVVFEGTAAQYLRWSPPAWVRGQVASRISNLVYSAPSQNTMRQVCARSKTVGAGYIYVTDDALPNPWDTMPAGSYWTREISACSLLDLAAVASLRRYGVGAVHVHEFMSLDGVIDAPTWTFDYGFDPQMGEAIGAVTQRSGGILLGRTTYEMFEPAWSTRTVEDDPGAPFFNDTTKYVVSATLTDPTWRNSKVIGPYDADAIRGLKDAVDGDLYVSGSGTLVRAMLADGLVDELHLFVYPLTRGSGPRLFPEEAAPGKLSLAACEQYDNGVVYLAYRPQG